MAYWGKRLKKKTESKRILLGDGINTFFPASKIKRSEATSSFNLSTHRYPSLSVRKGRENYSTAITTPNGIGTYLDANLHVVDGTTWKRWTGSAWTNVQTGLTNARANFVLYNTALSRFMICMNGTNKFAWDGTTVTTLTDAPATRLYCVDDYRLYALKDYTLYASAGGDITDWTTVLDAAELTLAGADGQATAITSIKNKTICFYENSMHVLYGNDPYDYYMNDPMNYGCLGDRAFIEHYGKLYFLWKDGLYVYSGGTPDKVSDKAKTYIEGINKTYRNLCCMGKHEKYIYISIPYGTATTNNITLEYDTQLDIWNIHNEGYTGFTNIAGDLIGLDKDGQSWEINSGDDDEGDDISWEWISGMIDYESISNNKTISDLYFAIYLPAGSTLQVYYSTGGDFKLLNTFKDNREEQITRIKVPMEILSNIPRYQLKLVGTGQCYIDQMDEYFRIKPRL